MIVLYKGQSLADWRDGLVGEGICCAGMKPESRPSARVQICVCCVCSFNPRAVRTGRGGLLGLLASCLAAGQSETISPKAKTESDRGGHRVFFGSLCE